MLNALSGALKKAAKKEGLDPRPPAGTKLRKVNYTEIESRQLPNTFWVKNQANLEKEEPLISITWDELVEDFKEREAAKKGLIENPEKLDQGQKPQKERILEDKKVNQFEIILARFPLTPELIKEELISLKLSYDHACQIAVLLPDEEVCYFKKDCLKLLDYKGDESLLADATNTVRNILKIPRAKSRVQCIKDKYEFAIDTKTLLDQMREYTDPFDVLLVPFSYKDSMTMGSNIS